MEEKELFGKKEKEKNLKMKNFVGFVVVIFLKTGKVADHCHFTGRFRRAAHPDCNLKATKPRFTPVFFHNLANYYSHLFIKALGKKHGKIKCIPNTEEKYISFSLQITLRKFVDFDGKEKEVKHEIRFVDSFKFMGFSLADLVANLEKD